MNSELYDSPWEKGALKEKEGREFHTKNQFKKACECYEKSIRYFKQHLENKPHDTTAHKKISSLWKAIRKLYPNPKDYEITTPSDTKEKIFLKEVLKKYKIALVDTFIEDNWKKQYEGKYGGPKPPNKTWKEFYEETEVEIQSIPHNQLVQWAITKGHYAFLTHLNETHAISFHDQLNQCDTHYLLLNAIQHGLNDIASFLINQDCDIDITDTEGRTPLHYAVMLKNPIVIEALLKKNANTKIKDNKGCIPLHWAISKGSLEIISTLLEHHSDINTPCILEVTPLHWSVYTGYTDMVLHLLSLNANINAQDYLGKTPLHWAVINNQNLIAHHLINHGAKVTIKDHFQRTPLHWAAQLGNYECAQYLIHQNISTSEPDTFGDAPLVLAAQYGHTKIVSLFSQHIPQKPEITPA